jgi:hypothetical protein
MAGTLGDASPTLLDGYPWARDRALLREPTTLPIPLGQRLYTASLAFFLYKDREMPLSKSGPL